MERLSPEESRKAEGLTGPEDEKYLTPADETFEDVERLAEAELPDVIVPQRKGEVSSAEQSMEISEQDIAEHKNNWEAVRQELNSRMQALREKKPESCLIFMQMLNTLVEHIGVFQVLCSSGKLTNTEMWTQSKMFLAQMKFLSDVLGREISAS